MSGSFRVTMSPNVDDQVSLDKSVDTEAIARIRQAVDDAGGQAFVSRKSAIPLSTLKSYLNGRELRRRSLVALATATDVSIEWLATGLGTRRREEAPRIPSLGLESATDVENVPEGFVAVPRLDIIASAGSGSAPHDHNQVVDYFAFNENFLRQRLHRRIDELALIEARGNSMEPSIHDGDILIVDIRPSTTIDNGRLYVLRVDNDLLVKRLERRMDGSLTVHSDNPRYAPDTIPRANMDSLQIIGRVMMVTTPPR